MLVHALLCILRRGFDQCLVEMAEHGMQPVAEVALVDFDIELVGTAQPQLPQARRSDRGSGASLRTRWSRFSPAGSNAPDGVGYSGRLHGHVALRARIDCGLQHMVELQRLHQRTRADRLAAGVGLAPDQFAPGVVQGRGPGRALRGFEGLARRQAQFEALGRAPVAGRLGRCGQAAVVATGDDHGAECAAQQLVQRQHDHPGRLVAGGRHEARVFEHVAHPGGELGERVAAAGELVRVAVRIGIEPQRADHLATCDVVGERCPLPAGFQQFAQCAQPFGQGPGPGHRHAAGLDVLGEGQQRDILRLLAASHQCAPGGPVAQPFAAQPRFERLHGQRVAVGAALEPFEHLVAAGVVGAGTQRAHQRGGGARGRELPARFVVRRDALRLELGADAARERTVDGDQRDRGTAFGQMAQHAGGGQFGFVFRVGGDVRSLRRLHDVSAGTSERCSARSPHSMQSVCVSGSVWKPSSTISASTWLRVLSRSSTSVA
jgi:hypothetical protein